MKTNIKIDRKSALLSALKLLPKGGIIELTLDPAPGHWNAVVKPTDVGPIPASPALQGGPGQKSK